MQTDKQSLLPGTDLNGEQQAFFRNYSHFIHAVPLKDLKQVINCLPLQRKSFLIQVLQTAVENCDANTEVVGNQNKHILNLSPFLGSRNETGVTVWC